MIILYGSLQAAKYMPAYADSVDPDPDLRMRTTLSESAVHCMDFVWSSSEIL